MGTSTLNGEGIGVVMAMAMSCKLLHRTAEAGDGS